MKAKNEILTILTSRNFFHTKSPPHPPRKERQTFGAEICFSFSQNHRIVGVGRDLCGSSSPTPLPKQGHLQQAAQDLVQICSGI